MNLGVGIAGHFGDKIFDNGVYIIKDWFISGRVYQPEKDDLWDEPMLLKMLTAIDAKQPEKMRLDANQRVKVHGLVREIIEARPKETIYSRQRELLMREELDELQHKISKKH